MAFRWARQGVVLALLVTATSGASAQVQLAAPPNSQAAGGQAHQLGRPFTRQVPPPPVRKSPRVYVSVVSPQQQPSNVFQHIGQRGQSNGRSAGGMGGMGNGGGPGTGGGMGSGFPSR
jgi:hypothetical protein